MNDRVKTFFESAQELTSEEREELIDLLQATVDVTPEIEKAWAEEIADRIAAHERGEMRARPAAEVLAKHLKS